MKFGKPCLLAAALAATVGFAQPASAETVLKFASFVPPQYILHKPIFLKLADDLDKATGGEVKIKVYAAGALGKGPVEQYQRAVRRVAEISYGLPGYTSSVFPKTLLIELPGVTQGHQDATRKLWKVMDAHLRDEFKRTRPLAVFVTPPAVFMMRDKPVRTLEDLKGLKIRVASKSAASVISSYGATPGADAGDQGLHLDEHRGGRRRADGFRLAAHLQADRTDEVRHRRSARNADHDLHGDEPAGL